MELRVELRGFEPLTFCMPCSRVSSDGVVLGLVTAVQSGSDVWGRLARSGEIWGRWYLVWSWFAGSLTERCAQIADYERQAAISAALAASHGSFLIVRAHPRHRAPTRSPGLAAATFR